MTEARREHWQATDGTAFAGTLLLPEGQWRQRPPAALLISGSGPLDRDSNTETQKIDISKALAEHLAEIGVASLRFDKRGVGSSGGDALDAGFHLETSDAADALDHLTALDVVDAQRVAVIGHSAGATQAIRLAASKSTVAAAVLLAGAASSGRQVLKWQSDRIGPTLPGPGWLTGRLFRAFQSRQRTKLADPDTESIKVGGVRMAGDWFREYMDYDPRADLAKIVCPVLAITGAKDLQVDPAELATISDLVTGPCRAEAPSDLTHLLRATSGKPSLLQYRKLLERPVDPTLLARIGDWLADTLGA